LVLLFLSTPKNQAVLISGRQNRISFCGAAPLYEDTIICFVYFTIFAGRLQCFTTLYGDICHFIQAPDGCDVEVLMREAAKKEEQPELLRTCGS
jgi:hypothetical protein